MSFQTSTQQVYNDLKARVELTNLLTNGVDGIYPLVAPGNEGEKFITYHIIDNGSITKDTAKRYEVIVASFASHYDECCVLADEVTEAFKTSVKGYAELGGKPFQNEEGWLYIEQRFNIKI